MSSLLLLSISISLSFTSAIDCICNRCPAGFCTGDYCYIKEVDHQKQVTGCLTPREDVWKGETFPLCERNQFNSTLCLCNEDSCNKDETFATIKADGSYVEQKLVDCDKRKGWVDPDFPDFEPFECQSSYCLTMEWREYNAFRDLKKPPFSEVYRKCPVDEAFNAWRTDISLFIPQMNSCMHLIRSQLQAEVTCICNSPRCNEKIPMYNLTKRGKHSCYLKSRDTATSTCWGDYCFWSESAGEINRGCLDAAGADPNFKLQLGESALDGDFFVICEGNYCNSDIIYPNGTIVGPSARRKFSSSFPTQMSLTGPLLITITQFFT